MTAEMIDVSIIIIQSDQSPYKVVKAFFSTKIKHCK